MKITELINHHNLPKSEKRKHPRLSLHLPTEYYLDGSSRVHVGHTVDICEGGLLINIREKLEVNQDLKVTVYHPSTSEGNSIQALAEVVRVDKLDKPKREYRCAFKFIDLSPGDGKRLRIFLKSLY